MTFTSGRRSTRPAAVVVLSDPAGELGRLRRDRSRGRLGQRLRGDRAGTGQHGSGIDITTWTVRLRLDHRRLHAWEREWAQVETGRHPF